MLLSGGFSYHLAASIVGYQLREIRIRNGFVFFLVVRINVVKTNKVQEAGVVDYAQAKQLADARLGSAVLQLGQPSIGDAKSFVSFDVCNSMTRLFDLADSDFASIAKRLEHLASGHTNSPKDAGGD